MQTKGTGFAGLDEWVTDTSSLPPMGQRLTRPLPAKGSREPANAKSASQPTAKSGSGGIGCVWVILVGVVLLIIWFLFIVSAENEKKERDTRSTAARPAQTTPARSKPEYTISRPNAGVGSLKQAEANWCKGIENGIEAHRARLSNTSSQTTIDAFNRNVGEFNLRCAAKRAYERVWTHAENEARARSNWWRTNYENVLWAQ